MHYVIGDVHGCYDEMIAMITNIEKIDKDAQFIFTGDFVDRGNKVKETLDWVMNNITANGKYQSVKGNHEDMLIDWYNIYKKEYKYYRIPKTYFDFDKLAETLKFNQVTAYIEKMRSLPDIIIKNINDEEFHIVHAWDRGDYYQKAGYTDKKIAEDRLWNRDEENNLMDKNIDFIIIHGHTPTILCEAFIGYDYNDDVFFSHSGEVLKKKYSYNVDCGCTFGKNAKLYGIKENICKLASLCLETKDVYYIIPETLNFIKEKAFDLCPFGVMYSEENDYELKNNV